MDDYTLTLSFYLNVYLAVYANSRFQKSLMVFQLPYLPT